MNNQVNSTKMSFRKGKGKSNDQMQDNLQNVV